MCTTTSSSKGIFNRQYWVILYKYKSDCYSFNQKSLVLPPFYWAHCFHSGTTFSTRPHLALYRNLLFFSSSGVDAISFYWTYLVGMLVNTPQCTRQPLQTKTLLVHNAKAEKPWLRERIIIIVWKSTASIAPGSHWLLVLILLALLWPH